jgi:hypothetical protein
MKRYGLIQIDFLSGTITYSTEDEPAFSASHGLLFSEATEKLSAESRKQLLAIAAMELMKTANMSKSEFALRQKGLEADYREISRKIAQENRLIKEAQAQGWSDGRKSGKYSKRYGTSTTIEHPERNHKFDEYSMARAYENAFIEGEDAIEGSTNPYIQETP